MTDRSLPLVSRLVPFLVAESQGDMGVVYNQVVGEGGRAAFSSIEEHVGGDGRKAGAQERKELVGVVPADRDEDLLR